jgi:hypothetical protein
MFLKVHAPGQDYQIGPLEKGGYAVGPNSKFLVYCSNSGTVYAARIGFTALRRIGSVKSFSIIQRNEAPRYEFEFLGGNPYTVRIHELILQQSQTVSIPPDISSSH